MTQRRVGENSNKISIAMKTFNDASLQDYPISEIGVDVIKSCKTNKAKAESNPNNRRAIALLRTLLPQHLSLTEMTALLNEQGFVTPNGGKFQITQVKRLIDRIG